MSVVKKLKTGGSATGTAPQGPGFKEYLANKLNETKFTANGEKEAREAASQFSRLQESENFKDIYSYDPIKHEYNIKVDKITDPTLQGMEWGGSGDAINKNLFGAFTGRGDSSNAGDVNAPRKKYNSLVASIYNDWKTSQTPESTEVSTGVQPGQRFSLEKSFKPIETYMVEQPFGGSESALNTTMSAMTDDNQRKTFVAQHAKNHADQYLQDFEKNKTIDKFSGIEIAQELKAITDKIDFTKPIDDATWKTISTTLNKTGSNPAGLLLSENQKKQLLEQSTAEAAATKVKDQVGKYTVADVVDPKVQEALFQQGFTEVDNAYMPKELGNSSWLTNLIKQSGVNIFKNPTTGDYRIMKGNTPWTYTGGLGQPDEGFSYTAAGETPGWTIPVPKVPVKPEEAVIATLNDENNPLSKYPSEKDHFGGLENIKKAIQEQQTLITKGQYRKSDWDKIAESVRKILKTNPNNPEAYGLYSDFSKLHGSYQFKKEGGVIKAAEGTKLTPEEYLKSHNLVTTPGAVAPAGKLPVLKDITGTFADQSGTDTALDVLSGAGLAASFAPGPWGAAGASVVLGADLAKDWKDGNIDNPWSHIANLGFVGLSFFGLGGLKGLLKTAKVGGETLKLGELASKAKSLKYGEDAIQVLQKHNITSLEQVENIAKHITDPADLLKLNESVKKVGTLMELVKNLQGATTPVLGSQLLGAAAKKVAGLDLGKFGTYAKYGVAGYMGAQAVPAVISTVSAIKDKGIEYTKPEDFKKIVLATSVANTLKQGLQGVRAINRQAERSIVTADKTAFKIGDELVEVKGLPPTIEAESKTILQKLNPFGKKQTAEQIKDAEQSLKEKLAKAYEATHGEVEALTKEEIAKIDLSSLNSTYGKSSGKFILGKDVKPKTGDIGTDIRDYNLAKRYLGKESIGTPAASVENLQKLARKPVPVNAKAKAPAAVNSANSTPVVPPVVVPPAPIVPLKPKRVYKKGSQKYDLASITKIVSKRREGGILKYEGGEVIKYNSNFPQEVYTSQAHDQILPSTPIANIKPNWQFNKGYTDKYLKFVNGLNDEWFTKNQGALNDFIKTQGGAYQVKDLAHVKTLAQDSLYGPVHNFMLEQSNKEPDTSVVPGDVPTVVGATPTVPTPGSGISPMPSKSLPYTPKKYFDPTRLTNLAQYLNTVVTNKKVGREQRAVAGEIPRLETMPLQYFRTGIPNMVAAEQQARNATGVAKIIAGASSDINRGILAQLSTATKVGDMMVKAQSADEQRNRAGLVQNQGINTSIGQRNLATINQNSMYATTVAQQVHKINANETLANAGALNNLIMGEAKAWPTWKYKRGIFDLQNMMNNPNIEATSKYINRAMSPEREAEYKALWAADMKANPNTTSSWETSPHAKALQAEIKRAQAQMEKYTTPIMLQQANLRTQEPTLYMKSGGGISFNERVQLEQLRHRNKKELKEDEQFYKTILSNNTLLQKSMIKVFK